MIFEKLTLHNFGLFRGKQELDLYPLPRNGSATPIILFGGMNGGGKTTILDAVKLALYGSRGSYSKKANITYDEFLRDSINRGVAISTGASVALDFRITRDGEEHAYQVHRAWQQRGRTIRERVCVCKDGIQDQYASDHWTDLVEEVIPLGVSQLFFFDAEQIRFLADEDTAQASLGNAIKSLLGLDLAERLITDASVLENRFTQQMAAVADDPEVVSFQAELDAKESELRRAKEDRAGLTDPLQRAKNAKQKAEDAFAAIGGKHWQEREARSQTLSDLKSQRSGLELQLAQLAAGALPLVLVSELLGFTREQDAVEKQAAEQAVIDRVLADRDRQILKDLTKEQLSKDALNLIRKVFDADRRARCTRGDVPQTLCLSDASRGQLHRLCDGMTAELRTEAVQLIEGLSRVVRDLESAEHSAATVPDDADIASHMTQLQETTKEFAVLTDRADRLDAEIDVLQSQRNDLHDKLLARRRATVERELASEQATRTVKLAIRTQVTMRTFLTRATAAKIDQLSHRVTESFRFLLRKKTLAHQVQIDPVTFAISLFDDHGHPIPKHRLSEGEKQVFAVSVLWGLAQSSPRPLPAIIDTPMARLDSEHRLHLIERYFPNASHQVIILSTDTEVDQDFYVKLQPHIARAYHLNYDEAEKVTLAREGYFWHSTSPNGRKAKKA
jgi:DNA sulfur modification protein DndD